MLKRFFLAFVLVVNFVLAFTSVSFASEWSDFSSYTDVIGAEHTEYDDNGYCIKGVVSYGFAGKDVVQVKWASGKGLYIICDDTGSTNVYTFFDVDGNFDGYYICQYTKAGKRTNNPTFYQNNNIMGLETDFFHSTIPIFNINDVDAINAYKESGDASGSSNYDYINSASYSDEIEKPHNLKLSGKFSYMTSCSSHGSSFGRGDCMFCKPLKGSVLSVAWSIPDDVSYLYDIDVRANGNSSSGQFSTSWVSVVRGGKYSSSSVAAIYDLVHIEKNTNILNDCVLPILPNDVNDITGVSLRIRHRKGKSCSNWVVITVGTNGSASAKVENDDGGTVDDSEYTNSDGYDTNDGSDGDGDTSNDGGSTNVGGVDISELMIYIRDGFGLLGSGGIISLMSQTFLFLPNSIWVIIKFFISTLITISVIGAVVKIVF